MLDTRKMTKYSGFSTHVSNYYPIIRVILSQDGIWDDILASGQVNNPCLIEQTHKYVDFGCIPSSSSVVRGKHNNHHVLGACTNMHGHLANKPDFSIHGHISLSFYLSYGQDVEDWRTPNKKKKMPIQR